MQKKNLKTQSLLLAEFSQKRTAHVKNSLLIDKFHLLSKINDENLEDKSPNVLIKYIIPTKLLFTYYKFVFSILIVMILFSFVLYNIFPSSSIAFNDKTDQKQYVDKPEDSLDFNLQENQVSIDYKPNDLVNISIPNGGRLRKDALILLKGMYEESILSEMKFKVFKAYVENNDKAETSDPDLRLGTSVILICDSCQDTSANEANQKLWNFLSKISEKYGFSNLNNELNVNPKEYKFRYYGI